MSLKNQNHINLDLKKLQFVPFLCDDMSVKQNDKTYSVCNNKDYCKDHPCFGYLQLYIGKIPSVVISTPKMKCLFGVQKNGNNFNMSLQFSNLKEDLEMKSFFDTIRNIEFECMKNIGLTEDDAEKFVSQIKYDKHKKYDPNLSVKLPFSNNSFQTTITSENSSAINIFNIQNFTNMECGIYLDKIWRMNDKFYAKWKCNKIHIL
jgi:hypothetical protein